MSDLDTIKAMLDRSGIKYRGPEDWEVPEEGSVLIVREGDGPNNVGYSDFLTKLHFDEDGALISWGTWE